MFSVGGGGGYIRGGTGGWGGGEYSRGKTQNSQFRFMKSIAIPKLYKRRKLILVTEVHVTLSLTEQ